MILFDLVLCSLCLVSLGNAEGTVGTVDKAANATESLAESVAENVMQPHRNQTRSERQYCKYWVAADFRPSRAASAKSF